jgi:hypothetical protein
MKFIFGKKTFTIAVLMLTVVALSAFMPAPEKIYKNLKVLPKDISKEELGQVMDGFKTALGVKCNFCHAPQADNPKKLDFVSDAKPEKEVARKMMRMTAKINKKYFHDQELQNGKALLAVSCVTCHNGNEHPKSL